jgi:membrane carboxypeptidase/penicillin-binding protein
MQCAAEKTISSRIAQIAKARKAARDLEGSLVALDPASGEVRALVGGRDFARRSYIRATQARRSPGPRSSRSSTPPRSSAAWRRRRCCTTSTSRS